MSEGGWEDQADLLEKARAGDEDSISTLCEWIDSNWKYEIKGRLRKAGVARTDLVDNAYHDLLLRVRERIHQLRRVACFKGWLKRVERDVAKAYRPRYLPHSKPGPGKQHAFELPRQIATKHISVNGEDYTVKVFEPCPFQEQSPTRERFLEPLSDSIMMNWGKCTPPAYGVTIDVHRALEQLQDQSDSISLDR